MKTRFPSYLHTVKSCEPIELDNCQISIDILEEKCLDALSKSSIDQRYISSIETILHNSLSKRRSRYVNLENVSEVFEELNRDLICTFSIDIESSDWDVSVKFRNPGKHVPRESISLFGALMMALKKFQGTSSYNLLIKKMRPTSQHESEAFRLTRMVSAVQDLGDSTLARVVREAAMDHRASF